MFSIRKSLTAFGLLVTTATASLLPIAAYAQESYAGNLVGGIAGALLGGNGKIAATAAGGIIGAIVGGNVERGSGYRQGYSAPQPAWQQSSQQSYYAPAPQQVPQYATRTEYATYAQPIYAEPVYEQRTYTYSQPEVAYGYVDREQRQNNWHERHERDEEHREWHRDHDRGDSYGWR
jgi:hypothetical protein